MQGVMDAKVGRRSGVRTPPCELMADQFVQFSCKERRKLSHIRLGRCDLGLATNVFDCVLSLHVLFHLTWMPRVSSRVMIANGLKEARLLQVPK
jgi:hypothetical protein